MERRFCRIRNLLQIADSKIAELLEKFSNLGICNLQSSTPAAPRSQSLQCFDQNRAGFLEIHLTGGHNLAQNVFTFGTDTYKDESAVAFVPLAVDEAALFEAIDQFDCAVMTKAKADRKSTRLNSSH